MKSIESVIFGILLLAMAVLLPGGMLRLVAASNGSIPGQINKIFSNAGIPGGPGILAGINSELHKSQGGGVTAFHGSSSTSAIGIVNNAGKSTSKATNTKCISNSPNGGTPHITRQGNVIIGSDCDITIEGDDQGNIIFTGNGNDVVYAGTGNDIIYAGSGTDQIYGGKGNDLLVAGSGTDLLDGGPGDDVLLGGTGNDLLTGGLGNDKLFAGTGNTVMVGGPGADHFDCGSSVTAKAVVMDYNPIDGDTISGNCKLVNRA